MALFREQESYSLKIIGVEGLCGIGKTTLLNRIEKFDIPVFGFGEKLREGYGEKEVWNLLRILIIESIKERKKNIVIDVVKTYESAFILRQLISEIENCELFLILNITCDDSINELELCYERLMNRKREDDVNVVKRIEKYISGRRYLIAYLNQIFRYHMIIRESVEILDVTKIFEESSHTLNNLSDYFILDDQEKIKSLRKSIVAYDILDCEQELRTDDEFKFMYHTNSEWLCYVETFDETKMWIVEGENVLYFVNPSKKIPIYYLYHKTNNVGSIYQGVYIYEQRSIYESPLICDFIIRDVVQFRNTPTTHLRLIDRLKILSDIKSYLDVQKYYELEDDKFHLHDNDFAISFKLKTSPYIMGASYLSYKFIVQNVMVEPLRLRYQNGFKSKYEDSPFYDRVLPADSYHHTITSIGIDGNFTLSNNVVTKPIRYQTVNMTTDINIAFQFLNTDLNSVLLLLGSSCSKAFELPYRFNTEDPVRTIELSDKFLSDFYHHEDGEYSYYSGTYYRSLVVHDRTIVARNFSKFVPTTRNVDETNYVASLKMDGTCCCVWVHNDTLMVSTKKKPSSHQAIMAKKYLENHFLKHNIDIVRLIGDLGITIITEWIHPENRLTVDYGKLEMCFLLGIVNNRTGVRVSYDDLVKASNNLLLPIPPRIWTKQISAFDHFKNFNAKQKDSCKIEGFVVENEGTGVVSKLLCDNFLYHRHLIRTLCPDVITYKKNHFKWENIKENIPKTYEFLHHPIPAPHNVMLSWRHNWKKGWGSALSTHKRVESECHDLLMFCLPNDLVKEIFSYLSKEDLLLIFRSLNPKLRYFMLETYFNYDTAYLVDDCSYNMCLEMLEDDVADLMYDSDW